LKKGDTHKRKENFRSNREGVSKRSEKNAVAVLNGVVAEENWER